MSAQQKTLVTFLLDRSSSMASIVDSTIEAFNGYVAGLKAEPDAAIDFSFLLFDDYRGCEIVKVFIQQPIAAIPAITRQTYRPRGGTPLIEAAYKTIVATEAALKARSDTPKVVICIQTDGEENASKGYTWDALKTLILLKQELGWQFNFLGAGIDAYQQGAKMGIQVANTMSYESSDPAATRSAFYSEAVTTNAFAAGRAETTMKSATMRSAAGDKYGAAAGVGGVYPGVGVKVGKSVGGIAPLDLTSAGAIPPMPAALDLTH